jgi:hypothetical protein
VWLKFNGVVSGAAYGDLDFAVIRKFLHLKVKLNKDELNSLGSTVSGLFNESLKCRLKWFCGGGKLL